MFTIAFCKVARPLSGSMLAAPMAFLGFGVALAALAAVGIGTAAPTNPA